jgi:hypothetical protein
MERDEIRLGELALVEGDDVTLDTLRKAGLIGRGIKRAKIIKSGSVSRAFTVRGVAVTKPAPRRPSRQRAAVSEAELDSRVITV